MSELDLNANSTNIGLIFEKINSDYQKKFGGVVFTDGQQTSPPIQELYQQTVKSYTLGIGGSTPMLDVFIRTVNSPPLSVKGQKVNIDEYIEFRYKRKGKCKFI